MVLISRIEIFWSGCTQVHVSSSEYVVNETDLIDFPCLVQTVVIVYNISKRF